MSEQSFVFDPRVFITSPFTTCPYCGEEEYGLLMVVRHGYVKRCRACMKDERFRLPKLEKKVLYLDQFAISMLMKVLHPEHRQRVERRGAEEERYWRELFDRLERLIKLQVLICPRSDAHCEESLLGSQHEELRRIYEHLSGDVRFEEPGLVKDGQILRAFEAWLGQRNRGPVPRRHVLSGNIDGWTDKLQIEARLGDDREFVEEFRRARSERHQGLSRAVEVWRAGERLGFETYFQQEVAAYGEGVLRTYGLRLQEFAQVIEGRRAPDEDFLFPPRAQILIMQMKEKLREQGVEYEEEGSKLREFFASEAMAEVPFLRIAAGMFAAYAVKASLHQAPAADQGMVTDINFVSSYLPYCDALFIDNGAAQLLAEADAELGLGHEAKVFSTRTRGELLEWLAELDEAVTEAHLKLVEQVYGPDWLRPYREIFTAAA
jgi:hypothetical protein